MLITEYMIGINSRYDYLTEKSNLPPGLDFLNQQNANQQDDLQMQQNQSPDGLIEFEDIKKYIMFGKVKDLKLKLELSNLDRKNPDITNIFEFIDIIMLFYNGFTYSQIVKLLDVLMAMIQSVTKIKLPEREDNEPAVDPQKVAAVQSQQQGAELQQQQLARQDQMQQIQMAQQAHQAAADIHQAKQIMQNKVPVTQQKSAAASTTKPKPRSVGGSR